MTMRSYDDIEFRPWYLPDTARWLKLSLGARGLVAELLRKLDRHGRIALGEDPAADLAVILRLDEADTRAALTELLAAGRLVWDPVERLLSDPDLPARMRMGSAARMAKKRAKASEVANDVPSHPSQSVTPVTTTHNPSPSDLDLISSGSDLEDPREPTSNRAREGVADALSPPPDWWTGVCETVSASCLGSATGLKPPECWLAYAGHRNGKGRRPDRNDAVQWLTQVMVPKAKEAIRQAARDRERDAKYDAARARPPGAPEPLRAPSPEQAKRDAERFAAQIASRKKGAA